MESQRDAFFNAVYDLAKADRDVIIVSADMGAPALDRFRVDLPGQFINVGIAEQQAITLSAGLAKEGKKVYVYAIAPFITYRCFDQIKVSIASMCLPITIVGCGAGFSYDDSGPTHHAVEDLGIMRTLPFFQVFNMTDSEMASEFALICYESERPNYVRLDRGVFESVSKNIDYTKLKGVEEHVFGDEKKPLIIATGNMVHTAIKVGEETGASVIDVYTFPINEEAFLETIKGHKRIITLEEHTLPGGLGSAVLELLADNGIQIPVKRIGLDFYEGYCYRYGGRKNLQKLYGLDKKSIIEVVNG